MERLRAPGGCPWDQEQTFDSIKPYTLEETYEVLEAIDNRDWPELAGELGDLLLQVLFYAEMAQEQSSFSIDDVLDRLSSKLINRHPHVFGEVKADTSDEVNRIRIGNAIAMSPPYLQRCVSPDRRGSLQSSHEADLIIRSIASL